MYSDRDLSEMIAYAEDLLKRDRKYFTDGSVEAVEYLLDDAKKALRGEYKRPFNRCRGFFEPRQGEDIQFVTERYTMTPGYGMKKYGLKPALKWLETTRDSEENVREKNKRRRKRLGSMHIYDNNLFFKSADAEKNRAELLERIDRNPLLAEELERIKKISERYSVGQTAMFENAMSDTPDYDALNREFFMWSRTESVFNGKAPENAVCAKLRFVLPGDNNEESGLGHIWLDDVTVTPANGADWKIENAGFEAGLRGWLPLARKGSPVIRHEDKKPFCGAGSGSVYIENPTAHDEGGIESEKFIETQGGVRYSFKFNSKQDGFLISGIRAEIVFFDGDKNPIDTAVFTHRRKSLLAAADFMLTVQADSIMYFLERDESKGLKAKRQMFFILNDFCQGIEHWLVYNSRPLGSDAYGAVQGGRILCSLAASYTFIKDLFDEDEKARLMSFIDYFLPYLMDLRDRCELTEYEAQRDAGNWQTDMAAGVGMWMLAMPEYPNAKQWLLNADYTLKSQLEVRLHKDGSWPESIRYHFAVIDRFGVYAYACRCCTNRDWFKETRLKDMFGFVIGIMTPPYEYFDNKVCTPNFGDHALNHGEQFAVMAPYINAVNEVDGGLAGRMLRAWRLVGCPRADNLNGENVVMRNLFCDLGALPEDGNIRAEGTSTVEYKESGVLILRDEHFYIAAMASPEYIEHGHYDEGSLIIYKDNVPVVIDPSIESYFDSTKDWYVSSSAHSTLQFERRGGAKPEADAFDICLDKTDYSAMQGWNDTPRSARLLYSLLGSDEDRLIIRIENTEGGVHYRDVRLDHKLRRIRIVDTVEGYSGRIRVNYPIAARRIKIDGRTAFIDGYYGSSARLTVSGDNLDISREKGRCVRMFPCDGEPSMDIIRVIGSDRIETVIE